MAIQQVTDPMMLDSTGQDIVQKLELIKQAVQPTNACIDVDVSLPTTGWTGNGPYTYTYNNAHISTGCKVKVNFLETESTSGGVLYLEYEKIVGGVQFTAQSVPTDPIPVRIHILNADAESIMATTADEVSTNAIAGASNVEQALSAVSDDITDVNDKVGDVPSGQTVEGQIEALNSKLTAMSESTGVTYTAANTWTSADKEIEIPANSVYGILVGQTYNQAYPLKMALSSTNNANEYNMIISNGGRVTETGYNNSNSPIKRYILCQTSASSGYNGVYIYWWYRKI